MQSGIEPIKFNSLMKKSSTVFISLGLSEGEADKNVLEDIIRILSNSKKTLVATGAGISVSAGIPDFRSEDGLYNIVKKRYPNVILKGKDLFDAKVFQDINSSQVFFSFMAELKLLIEKANITPTHKFIKWLEGEDKLLRCYTQNIDCLEKKLNMNSHLDPKNKKSNKIVQVHGDMDYVFCVICRTNFDFNQEVIDVFKDGQAFPCKKCESQSVFREKLGKRGQREGFLRPNIVLYNEHHVNGDLISEYISHDIKRKPDFMIVMGTSLKVVGMKQLVKEMAKKVHESKKGKVILINKTDLGREWDQIFDFIILADCDTACIRLENGCKNYKERERLSKIYKERERLSKAFSKIGVESKLSKKKNISVTINSTLNFKQVKKNYIKGI
ncbi:hypothetical protein HK099_008622 [Clydaea vesicula]|uniref:Deacetylase sirtuin-type domain-containing protein n=1 Tax=Clydaea vesicula TaxID=447962 RepID=A0AAD5U4R2_9FUNG|nr:hypothetical protein HK099_008622 [Clydaea vesicula]KAJ3390560.1 hypothetical protein HDU92_000399 [Lobulomyces angularis]